MNLFYTDFQSIEKLITEFNTQTLPVVAWTHEAHLTVALYHLYHYEQAEATCLLRSGIITYNNAVGTANNANKGYHETITLFWIKIISNYLKNITKTNSKDEDFVTICNDFLHSKYAKKDYLLEFYSPEIIFSIFARAFWINPDKKDL
jgi:hypothetical protein